MSPLLARHTFLMEVWIKEGLLSIQEMLSNYSILGNPERRASRKSLHS